MRKLLIALVPVTLLCGCFTSEQPFYEASDVVTDDRLIGDYGYKPYHWEIRKGDWRTYDVAVVGSASCSMKFTGVLFHVGTNTFIDLLPVLEQTCDHSSAGGTPGLIEILQGATIKTFHMVFKVDIRTNEIAVGGVDNKNLQFTKEEAREYFANCGGPVDHPPGAALRLYPDTKLERQFLLKYGSNTNIFLMQPMKRLASKQ